MTVYVLTCFRFNHPNRSPDSRLFAKDHVFYCFDAPPPLPVPCLLESAIYPEIAELGRQHLGEWAFFLAEYRRPFASYPFYAISSRFYEKNTRLPAPLTRYMPCIFEGLLKYGYGYLPSYDRAFSFADFTQFASTMGTTPEGLAYYKAKYGVEMLGADRFFSDFACNYIGFQSRKHFEAYVEFYLPVLDEFFSSDGRLVKDYMQMNLVRANMPIREFKPMTYFLEVISHIFFVKNQIPFYGLSYDWQYEVREWEHKAIKLRPLP